MPTKTHQLKTVQPWFEDIWDGIKKFELRKNDRGYKVNDILILREWDQKKNIIAGHRIKCRITYVMDNFDGLLTGYAILGIKILQRIKEPKQ